MKLDFFLYEVGLRPGSPLASLALVVWILGPGLAGPVRAGDAPAPPAVDWPSMAAETLRIMQDLVKIDTTNPPGNETAACRYLQGLLEKDGIEVRVLESAPGRGNLIARVPGTGGGKPVLWMAHLDVVGIAGQDWEVGAFAAERKDGYLYGRGVIDDKGMAVLGVQVARALARHPGARRRDLVLALTADEESSAKFGVAWLLEKHPELLDVDFAINEGGTVLIEGGAVRSIEVQTAEKIYLDVTLRTEGPSGHSSVPLPDNAIDRMARALTRVAGTRMPVELTETTRAFYAAHLEEATPRRLDSRPPGSETEDAPQAPLREGPPRTDLLKELLGDDPEVARVAGDALSREPYDNALLRTTWIATTVEGGTRVNVLPSKVSANVNCRILPGTDPELVLEALRRAIDDPAVTLEYDPADLAGAPPSPVDHPFFEAVRRAAGRLFPGAKVIPMMSTGATDSRFFRARGVECYGLLPFPITRDDKKRMHGANERLALESIAPGLSFSWGLVEELILGR